MTQRSRLAETRSLGLGIAIVVGFMVVLEATRRLDVSPGALSDQPFAVATGIAIVVVFAVIWIVTDSAFES